MTTILVTGGAGFIGSHLTAKLLAAGYRVVCIDNFNNTYDPFSKWEHIVSFRNHPGYRLLSVDIRDQSAVQQTMESHNVDAVVHLAALAGVRPSIQNPLAYIDTNISGTLSVLESMKNTGIRKLIFASSSSVYGAATQGPFSENSAATHPVSPYALTKRTGEMLCENYFRLYGIETFCLRFFTVYGPGQRPEMAISLFLNKILNDEPITVFGNGESARDYTYVADIADGILAALKALSGYEIINLGSNQVITLNELIHAIEKLTGKNAIIQRLPDQPGDVPLTHADLTKAQSLLNYTPKTSLNEGLLAMLRGIDHPLVTNSYQQLPTAC